MFAFLTTLGVFGLILLLTRLRVPLTLAVLAGAVAIGLMFGLTAGELVGALIAGVLAPITLGVLLTMVALLLLSQVLRDTGRLQHIVELARLALRRPGVAMAALPALIGFLPMPGGALFSAPMVESAAGGTERGGAKLSAINFWFRHIWEHWWPLYPGVILALSLTGSDLGVWVAFQIPMGLMMAASGLLLFRGTHPDVRAVGPAPGAGARRRLLRATLPIWLVVVVWGAVRAALLLVPKDEVDPEVMELATKFVPIFLGLLTSIVVTARGGRMKLNTVGRLLLSKTIGALLLLVASVMAFQAMVEHIHVAPRIAEELEKFSVPVVLIVAALPFIAGIVTGLAIGFVGVSFPIVLKLVDAMPDDPTLRPYIVLAFAFGHLGMMLSPLHLCHIVSNRYFQTPLPTTYRLLAGPAIVTATLAAAYFLLLKACL
jgi:uncharacterized protein